MIHLPSCPEGLGPTNLGSSLLGEELSSPSYSPCLPGSGAQSPAWALGTHVTWPCPTSSPGPHGPVHTSQPACLPLACHPPSALELTVCSQACPPSRPPHLPDPGAPDFPSPQDPTCTFLSWPRAPSYSSCLTTRHSTDRHECCYSEDGDSPPPAYEHSPLRAMCPCCGLQSPVLKHHNQQL